MDPYWIETGSSTRLAFILRPRGGVRLKDELLQIKQAGIDVLVSMLEPVEAASLGLAEEAELSRANGLHFLSFPIPDHQTPHSYASFANFIEQLRTHTHAGRSIAVHCFASIGRSSMLLAALLTTEGLSPNEAFERLTRARGVEVPDTPDQLRWVERFAATHKLRPSS